MPQIHPSAVIARDVQLASDVTIGPGCVLEGDVRIGAGTELIANVFVRGPVQIGARNRLYPGTCIGFEPQDYKFKPGMPTAGVVIGDDNLLREHVTVHAATRPDVPTRIGDRCMLMVSAHLGHDSGIGSDVILVNNVCLGGFAQLADKVTLGGGTMIHQFVRIGRLAFLSGNSGFSTDIPPFCVGWGRNTLMGLNVVGLRRSGVPRDQITVLRQAFRQTIKANLQRPEQVLLLRELAHNCPPVGEMADFIESTPRTIARYIGVRKRDMGAPDEAVSV